MPRALALALLLFAACGTVTADPHDAGGGQGGAGGQLAAVGGQGGHDVAGGAGGASSATGGAAGAPTSSGGAGGGETCLGPDVEGFALNIDMPCPMGDAAACVYSSDHCCYAHCTLNNVQYVGCLSGSAVASRCYASCSDCP
jgi:hypothetical protein